MLDSVKITKLYKQCADLLTANEADDHLHTLTLPSCTLVLVCMLIFAHGLWMWLM